MAKGDLYKLIEEIHTVASTELRYDLEFNVHVLHISKEEITKEIKLQLAEFNEPNRKEKAKVLSTKFGITTGRTMDEAVRDLNAQASFYNKNHKVIEEIAQEYCDLVYEGLVAAASSSTGYVVGDKRGSADNYTVEIAFTGDNTSVSSRYGKVVRGGNVYDFITDKPLQAARDKVRSRLNDKLKKELNQGRISPKEAIFNLGHITAVSTVRATKALSSIKHLAATSAIAKEILEYEILSKFAFSGEIDKSFEGKVSYVRPQSDTGNNLQSSFEKQLLTNVRNAIQKVLDSNKDWSNQAGSNTLQEAIAVQLMELAAKRGARVSGRLKKDFKPSVAKTKKTIDRKKNIQNSTASIGGVMPSNTSVQRSDVSLVSLIPYINQRLPEIIRSHMGQAGRLHNRTGRFSESAQVISIDASSTVTYSYQKNPYQVFESQGSRNPRPLIEKSIREIAVDIMATKFNLRRA